MIKQLCEFSSSAARADIVASFDGADDLSPYHFSFFDVSHIICNIIPSLHPTVQKIPGGQNVQAFVGTSILIGLCAIPVFAKDTKTGHDLFSQEKPQAIVDSESKLRKDYMDTKKERQQQQQQ